MKPHHCRCGVELDDRDRFGLCSGCGRIGHWCPLPSGHKGRCTDPRTASCAVCGRLLIYAIDDAGDVVAVNATMRVGGGHVLHYEQLGYVTNPPQRITQIPPENADWPFPSWEIHACPRSR